MHGFQNNFAQFTLLYIVFKMAHSEPSSGVKGKGNITKIYQSSLTASQKDQCLKSITDKEGLGS